MAPADVDHGDAALREYAAYLDLLREIGRHGAAAVQTLTVAHTASTAGQRRTALTTLAEHLARVTTAVHEGLAALEQETSP